VSFATRLREALAGTPWDAPLPPPAQAFAERRGGDEAAARLGEAALRGLARVLVTQGEVAAFTSRRPAWLARAAELGPGTLARRADALPDESQRVRDDELEPALDALRLRRREEQALAAVADLGGLEPFEAVSEFLSRVAEGILDDALALALREVRDAHAAGFSVLGMGRLAGRELIYHSDLDLIFLYQGETERIDVAARIGQRLIAYLTTMTGAGVAYEVDTRLRPSGRQGMLVTSCEAFVRYQTQQAQTWEHLAVLRARAVAGDGAGAALARVHEHVLSRREPPWPELAPLRERVEAERAREIGGRVALKTGSGGLMDVDFLAGGGLLERGGVREPALPSVPALLRACASGARVERLLAHYHALRVVEARARWLAGRGVDALDEGPALERVAALAGYGHPPRLLERVETARREIRAEFDLVVKSGSLDALERPL
jgi:glutamate-ammonia-ligase adenylyltransferase